MPHARHSKDEIVRRGEELYEREIRAHVEPDHNGEFLVLDIETGEYEIDDDHLAASDRATAKRPNGVRFALRIGQRTVGRIGARGTAGAR